MCPITRRSIWLRSDGPDLAEQAGTRLVPGFGHRGLHADVAQGGLGHAFEYAPVRNWLHAEMAKSRQALARRPHRWVALRRPAR